MPASGFRCMHEYTKTKTTVDDDSTELCHNMRETDKLKGEN